jgi:chitin disaccharide deacetylase
VKRLIINADDFGLTAGINQAVVELHQAGVLTSTTLMAHGAAADEAVSIARTTPTLSIGCHIVLVDGNSALPTNKIPSLVDKQTGRFHSNLGPFLRRLLSDSIRESEIEAEAAAQIALLQDRGPRLTHIDTHKHTHMFPAVLRPVLRAARAAGIRAIRNPFEPRWSVRATPNPPLIRRIEVNLLRCLEAAFQRIVAEEGFLTTNGTIGVLATGALDSVTIKSLLAHMPEGTWELITHPGHNDSDLAKTGTRLLASREVEREALLSLKDFPGAELKSELISFASLDEAVASSRAPGASK